MLWPYLKHLKVTEFDMNLLYNLVHRRIDDEKPLESLEIYMWSDDQLFEDGKLSWLKEKVVLRVHDIYR